MPCPKWHNLSLMALTRLLLLLLLFPPPAVASLVSLCEERDGVPPPPVPLASPPQRTLGSDCSSANSCVCLSRIRLNSSSVRASRSRWRRSTSANKVANVRPVSSAFFVPFCHKKGGGEREETIARLKCNPISRRTTEEHRHTKEDARNQMEK